MIVGSCQHFRNFIEAMTMGEINFKVRNQTWPNNRDNEGFIDERLDKFFAFLDWLLEFATTTVLHERNRVLITAFWFWTLNPCVQCTRKDFILME